MIFNCSLTLRITFQLSSPIKMSDIKSQKPKWEPVLSVGSTIRMFPNYLPPFFWSIRISSFLQIYWYSRWIWIFKFYCMKYVFSKVFKPKPSVFRNSGFNFVSWLLNSKKEVSASNSLNLNVLHIYFHLILSSADILLIK